MPHKSYNRILDEHLHILIAQGNHEAFIKLRKRYHKHALVLVDELIYQFDDVGVTRKELLAVCENHFIFVLSKYIPDRSSFYSFWKETSTQVLMDYIVTNSYDGDAMFFKGIISFDQNSDERHCFSEYLGERNDDLAFRRKLLDIKRHLKKYEVFFTIQEKALLNLLMEGYSISELEHSGLMSKSHLYLTYKSAVNKLQNYIKKEPINNH